MDKIHQEGQTDNHYLTRRRNTTLIGIHHTVPYKYRFASSMIKENHPYIADVMLVDLNDGTYGIEIFTEKGGQLIKKGKAQAAGVDLAAVIAEKKNAVKDKLAMPMDREYLPTFLDGKEKNAVWETRAKKCFSCGSCVLVCPTC